MRAASGDASPWGVVKLSPFAGGPAARSHRRLFFVGDAGSSIDWMLPLGGGEIRVYVLLWYRIDESLAAQYCSSLPKNFAPTRPRITRQQRGES